MSEHQATVTPLGAGRFRIVGADGRGRTAYGVLAGSRTWIFLDGRTYVIDASGPGMRRGSRHDDATMLSAPMPATVLSIAVEAGQAVRRGDVLIRLEAMKMEWPITAPRDGRVRAIACRAGELVQPGVALVELEPEQAASAETDHA